MNPLHSLVVHLHVSISNEIHDVRPRSLDDGACVVNLVFKGGLFDEGFDAKDVLGDGGGGCADLQMVSGKLK